MNATHYQREPPICPSHVPVPQTPERRALVPQELKFDRRRFRSSVVEQVLLTPEGQIRGLYRFVFDHDCVNK